MQILVDADAMPVPIKQVLFRAAERVGVSVLLVANQPMRVPESEWISSRVVDDGPDEADDWIVDAVRPGDLVVTADIPLADRVVERGAVAIDPRGTLYSEVNIKQRRAVRDLMDTLRSGGMMGGGPPPFHKKDIMAFANVLDRLLAKRETGRDESNSA